MNESVEMKCTSIGYPIASITWRSLKTNQILLPNEENSTVSSLVSTISLKNLAKTHSANYSCELHQNPSQRKIFFLIVQSKPSRPILTEVEVLLALKITRVVLYLDDNGESSIRQAYIEWSDASHFNETFFIRNTTSKFFFSDGCFVVTN